MKSKKILSVFLALSTVILMGASGVAAYDTYYDGWIGGNQWTWIGNVNYKTNNYKYSWINETSKGKFHTKYKITDKNNYNKGQVLLKSTQKGSWVSFTTSCADGKAYYLDGARQNILDPGTNVYGWYEA